MSLDDNIDWVAVEQIYQEVVALPNADRLAAVQKKCTNAPVEMREVLALLSNTDKTVDEPFCDYTPPTKLDHTLVGRTIDKYTLVSSLGAGGMGHVYEATMEQPKRSVAFKLFSQVLRSRQGVQRFKTEIEVLGNLSHPNIAKLYDAGTWDDGEGGVPWFAMELIRDGRTIIEYCASHRPSQHERLALFLRVCNAVTHAHQRGIVHRDLKPSNILVDKNGEVKIIDFGIARVTGSDLAVTTIGTSTGQIMGTIAYMSPEQCRGETRSIDLRSDVYSLGIVLYELLTGSRPFDLSNTTMLGAAQLIQEVAPKDPRTVAPALQKDLATIVLKAIEKEPDRRYQSSAVLAEDVLHFLENEPITATPPSVAYKAKKFIARNKFLVGSIAAVLLTIICGSIISVSEAIRANHARDDALLAEAQAVEARSRSMIVSAIDSKTAVGTAINATKTLGDSWEARYALSQLDQSVATWNLGVKTSDSGITTDGRYIIALGGSKNPLLIIDRHTNNPVILAEIEEYKKLRGLAIGPRMQNNRYIIAISVKQKQGEQYRTGIIVYSLMPSSAAIERIGSIWDVVCEPSTMSFTNSHPPLLTFITRDGKIECWQTGEKERDFRKLASVQSNSTYAHGVSISHDDSMLAVSGSDATTQLWSVDSLKQGAGQDALLAVLTGHRYKINDSAFSLDDTILATAGIDSTIRLWDINAAIKEAKEKKDKFASNATLGTLLGHKLGVVGVAFLGNNQLCSVSIDKTIRLWNVDINARPSKRVSGTPPSSIDLRVLDVLACERPRNLFTFERNIFTTSQTGVVQQWVPLPMSKIELLGHTTGVRAVVVLPESNYALTGGSDGDGSVIVWDIKRATAVNQVWDRDLIGVKDLRILHVDNKTILAVGLSIVNTLQNSAGGISKIVLWDMTDVFAPKRLTTYDIDSPLAGLEKFTTTPTGYKLLLATQNGDVKFLQVEVDALHNFTIKEVGHSQEIPGPLPIANRETCTFGGIEFLDAEGRFGIAARFDGRMVLIDTKNMHSKIISNKKVHFQSLAVSPNHDEIAIGDSSGNIHCWRVSWIDNLPTFVEINSFQKEHDSPVTALVYHPDSAQSRLFSGDDVGDIRVWDTSLGTWAFSLHGQLGSVFDLAFSPNGYHLVSTSGGFLGKENAGILWDAVPSNQQSALFSSRVRSFQARQIVENIMYDRPQSLEQCIIDIDEKGLEEEIPAEIIEEAKEQARFAFTVPKNWRLLWWARAFVLDSDATTDELKVASHWTATAAQSAPLRIDTLATHALALARVGRFDESLHFAKRALLLKVDISKAESNHQNPSIIMARIAKGIVAREQNDDAKAQEEFKIANSLLTSSKDSFGDLAIFLKSKQAQHDGKHTDLPKKTRPLLMR